MDSRKNTLEGAGDYIWLRYSTNLTIAGRDHTIEMGIPMPIGADEETREQLLREADAGMTQLASHVENRVAQMLQRVQPTQGTIPAPQPTAKPSVTPPPRPISRPPTSAPQPTAQPVPQSNSYRPASQPAPTSMQEEREAIQEQQPTPQNREVSVPPTRTTIGASMPTTGDVSGNLSIPQFIRHVKDQFDLNPIQAMEMLKLKSLSGINLREKLEQLQRLVGQEAGSAPDKTVATGTTDPKLKAVNSTNLEAKPSKPEEKKDAVPANTAPIPTVSPTPTPAKQPIPLRPTTPQSNSAASLAQTGSTATPQEPRSFGAVREERPSYGFDEELDLDDELEDIEGLDDLDLPRELTPQERVHAKNLVSKFRESQGAATANPARLKVLSNVAGGQVSDEQLQELTEGIWGISSLKKLKVDQVEALISWAKEDDFITDVDMVLALLEEEAIARGNR